MRHSRAFVAAAASLALAAWACERSPHSSAGFRLPQGNVERGRQAFVELRCTACHKVEGVPDLPTPTVQPPVPVVLGGEVPHARTDGELVTAMIHPSHRIAPGYAEDLIKRGERSRMPEFADVMSVRQLVDVVAFLQANTKVARPGATPR